MDFLLKQDMLIVGTEKRKKMTGAKYGDTDDAAYLWDPCQSCGTSGCCRKICGVLGEHTLRPVWIGSLDFEIGTQLGTCRWSFSVGTARDLLIINAWLIGY